MDAVVLLATTKYRDQADNPRAAVVHLSARASGHHC